MAARSTLRRVLAATAVSGIATLALAAPASARPDWGDATSSDGSSSSVITREVEIPVDDNAFEPWQVGLGVLGGIAVAGAGLAAANLRPEHRRHPRPA